MVYVRALDQIPLNGQRIDVARALSLSRSIANRELTKVREENSQYQVLSDLVRNVDKVIGGVLLDPSSWDARGKLTPGAALDLVGDLTTGGQDRSYGELTR